MEQRDQSAVDGAAKGAAAGSAAGPWGALIGGGAGLLSGMMANGNDLPTVDIGQLLTTIQGAGQYQQQIINQLPVDVQKQLQQYMAQNNAAGADYQKNITNTGNDYMNKAAALYGPNTDAANAQKDADRAAIYSTVPGTQDAIRNAMAATGGLARGNAGVALAQPYVSAAQQYGQAAMKTDATQTASGQNASQQALATVNSMNDSMFQNLFGMSKQQAQTILSTGNAALSTQLADLINQSNTQTGQTLSAEGIAANNGYQNAVTRNAQQNDIWSGLLNMGGTAIQNGLSNNNNGGGTGIPSTADTTSPDYQRNATNIATQLGY